MAAHFIAKAFQWPQDVKTSERVATLATALQKDLLNNAKVMGRIVRLHGKLDRPLGEETRWE